MSFRAVTWAFDQVKGLTATQKLVLLALAEFANDDDETWRSREVIARRAECSVSSVNQTVRVLREKGLLDVTGRYAWCDLTSPECAGRDPHKHRSGSTYRLNLDVTVTASPPMSPTLAKSASVENSAPLQGNSHTYNSSKYGPTLANQSTPHLHGAASVLSINPQLNPQPNQPDLEAHQAHQERLQGRSVGLGEEDSSVAVAAPDGARPQATLADMELVAQCLPQHLRVLDPAGLVQVTALLRERLDAGWNPGEIWQLMDQPVPEKVRRLAGVVSYRLRENVPLDLAPKRVRASSRSSARAVAEDPREDPVSQAWGDLVFTPLFQGALGDSGDYAGAHKATMARIKREGWDKQAFIAAWDGLGESVPTNQRGEAALTILGAEMLVSEPAHRTWSGG